MAGRIGDNQRLEQQFLFTLAREPIKARQMHTDTNKDIYKPEAKEIARLAKAIAHPARISILKILLRKDCICKDIVEELPLAQSTVSQHLKALKKADLIIGEINPPTVCYRLNRVKWKQASQLLNSWFLECC